MHACCPDSRASYGWAEHACWCRTAIAQRDELGWRLTLPGLTGSKKALNSRAIDRRARRQPPHAHYHSHADARGGVTSDNEDRPRARWTGNAAVNQGRPDRKRDIPQKAICPMSPEGCLSLLPCRTHDKAMSPHSCRKKDQAVERNSGFPWAVMAMSHLRFPKRPLHALGQVAGSHAPRRIDASSSALSIPSQGRPRRRHARGARNKL
jgi:hypothetical protein